MFVLMFFGFLNNYNYKKASCFFNNKITIIIMMMKTKLGLCLYVKWKIFNGHLQCHLTCKERSKKEMEKNKK